MKKLILLAAFVLPVLSASAQTDVTKEKFEPFYTTEQAPHLEKVLPGPPALTDVRFQDDWAHYQWGKSIRETERGKLAAEDAWLNADYFMKRYSPAVERELTPAKYPILYRLMSRAHRTEQQAGASAKRYFARVRPYQQFKEATAVPQHENPNDFTSYPSGHTHVSWLVGLILTAIDPAHTESIMKTAYDLGESRVIVGFHYESDIEGGRVAGSITFARLCADPAFQQMLQQAREEYQNQK